MTTQDEFIAAFWAAYEETLEYHLVEAVRRALT